MQNYFASFCHALIRTQDPNIFQIHSRHLTLQSQNISLIFIFFSFLFSFHHSSFIISFMKISIFLKGTAKISKSFRKGSDRGREAQRIYQRWISGIHLQLNHWVQLLSPQTKLQKIYMTSPSPRSYSGKLQWCFFRFAMTMKSL